jgi:hypothetical protein
MSNMRVLLESMSNFQQEKTIPETDLSEELMSEFLSFLEANATPTTGTVAGTQANSAATADTLKQLNQPNQPGTTAPTAQSTTPTAKPAQTSQPNQPALATQQVQDIKKAVTDIKTASANPNIDVNQAVTALTTNKVTPQNTKALDALGASMAPALADKSAAGQIKSLIQRLQAP